MYMQLLRLLGDNWSFDDSVVNPWWVDTVNYRFRYDEVRDIMRPYLLPFVLHFLCLVSHAVS